MRKFFVNVSLGVAVAVVVVGIITTSASYAKLTSLAINTGNFLW